MAKRVSRRRVWLRRVIPAVVVVVIIGGVFGTRAVASGSDGPSYRLGTVRLGSVQQTLSLSGTARAVNQTTSSFQVSGTVHSVSVGIGDHVAAGATIATLDGTALQGVVTSAKATLAQAKATLESDQDGTSGSSSSGSSGSSGSGSSSTASNVADDTSTSNSTNSSEVIAIDAAYVTTTHSGPTTKPTTPPLPTTPAGAAAAVKAAQDKLASDQKLAAQTLQTVTANQAAQTTACAGLSSSSGASAVTACANAVQTTIGAQTTLATDQTTVQTDETDLATQLANQAKVDAAGGSGSGSGSGTGSVGSGSGSGTRSGGSGGSSGSGSTSSTSTAASAQRITSDQAAIQAAQTALTTAKANLADATLTAPISGTVAALSLVAGSASGSDSVTIVGSGPVDVTVDVPLASLPAVKTGQVAAVAPGGSASPLDGVVHSISLLPASATTTTVSYPVVVRVAHPSAALASGSTATVTITLASVKDVITVPNSAVSTLVAGTAFVQTVKAGKVTRTLVRTGAVGATSTQVVSGLTAGQQVVIADLSEALPTTSLTSRFGARTGTGGLTSSLSGAGGLGGVGGVGGFGGGAGFGGGGFVRPGG